MKNIYVVYDTVAKDLLTMYVNKADTAAMRWFSDLLTQNREIGEHAEDYHLIKLGELDEEVPYIILADDDRPATTVVLTGAQVRASQQQQAHT